MSLPDRCLVPRCAASKDGRCAVGADVDENHLRWRSGDQNAAQLRDQVLADEATWCPNSEELEAIIARHTHLAPQLEILK